MFTGRNSEDRALQNFVFGSLLVPSQFLVGEGRERLMKNQRDQEESEEEE